MSEYLIAVTILFTFLGIVWQTSTLINVIFKIIFWVVVIWGLYLLFGPTNMIAHLSH